jgi:hypothetical protein
MSSRYHIHLRAYSTYIYMECGVRRSTLEVFFFNWNNGGGGVQLGPLGTAATNRPIVPAPGDYDDREIGGMIGRGNRSTRRKPAPVQLCPPQTPHAAWTRTRTTAVGSRWLTAWATARPSRGSSIRVREIDIVRFSETSVNIYHITQCHIKKRGFLRIKTHFLDLCSVISVASLAL